MVQLSELSSFFLWNLIRKINNIAKMGESSDLVFHFFQLYFHYWKIAKHGSKTLELDLILACGNKAYNIFPWTEFLLLEYNKKIDTRWWIREKVVFTSGASGCLVFPNKEIKVYLRQYSMDHSICLGIIEDMTNSSMINGLIMTLHKNEVFH